MKSAEEDHDDPTTAGEDQNTADGNKDQNMDTEMEDFACSQDVHESMDDEASISNLSTSNLSAITDPHHSPKKRRTDVSIEGIKTKEVEDAKWVIMAIPRSGTLEDTYGYLHNFKPGFGKWHDNQVHLANYDDFPGCRCVAIHCPIGLIQEFLSYTQKNYYFGKYQCQVATTWSKKKLSQLPKNEVLESLAKSFLIQHIKRAIHPMHEDDLQVQLLEIQDANKIMEFYARNWQKDGDFSVEQTVSPILVPDPQELPSDSEEENSSNAGKASFP